jgi:hypothetical protein
MPPRADPATIERLPAIRDANLALIRAFEAHPVYASQSTQRSGKIYFMWDFAQRTNAMLESVLQNPPPASMSKGQKNELAMDAVGRCVM